MILQTQNIGKHYGTNAVLAEVNLQISEGSFFGLLGPNGAGKTTLIGCLGGLVTPDSGDATVVGNSILTDSMQVRANIGIVPQELIYDPFLTVRESLVFQSKYYGLRHNGSWINTLLTRLHLQDKVDANSRSLSGGMKRRLMIAQALVHKPKVIILDEPTAGVDINLRMSLWEFMRELNNDGHTIILTTHYLEEAETLCDGLALMDKGRIISQGTTDEILATLNSIARLRVRANGSNPLPTLPITNHQGDSWDFDIKSYEEVEPILAAFRQAGYCLAEVEVTPPRLEDVFKKLIQKT